MTYKILDCQFFFWNLILIKFVFGVWLKIELIKSEEKKFAALRTCAPARNKDIWNAIIKQINVSPHNYWSKFFII